MNLFEMLVYTKDPNGSNHKYHLVSASNDLTGKERTESNAYNACVIPKIEDSTAIISMVKNFALTENLDTIVSVIESVISIYRFSIINNDNNGEFIKFTCELIRAIVNHKDFCIKGKDIINNKRDNRKFIFSEMIQGIPHDIVELIMMGKNFIPLYEAIGKMYELCAKEIDFIKNNDGDLLTSVSMLENNLIMIRFNSFKNYFRQKDNMESFEAIKGLNVDEEHFTRFIKLINSKINLILQNSRPPNSFDF